MPLPDNRIRLMAPAINFSTQVGVTGQEHDGYPAAGQQARFDHMRLFLIGLLANQSSYSEPTNFREGTVWFDLNTLTLRIRKSGAWVNIAEAIDLNPSLSPSSAQLTPLTLATWYRTVGSVLSGIQRNVSFSGVCTAAGVKTVTIPTSLRASIGADSRAFFFINGVLVDPRSATFNSTSNPSTITLGGSYSMQNGDRFTVLVVGIASGLFHGPDVVV